MSALLGVPKSAERRASHTALELYEAHGQRVLSFCLGRLRNVEEAQDAAQTTFMYVVRSLGRGVVPRNELAWLLTIADNVCRSMRRASGRRYAHVVSADVTELQAAALAMGPETNADIAALREALRTLPPRQRRAVLLREWQGLSYADIAHELGISLSAVETLLFRARRSLAAQLERSNTALRAINVASTVGVFRSVLKSGAAKAAAVGTGAALVIGPGVDLLVRPATTEASVPIVAMTVPTRPAAAPAKHARTAVAPHRRAEPRPAPPRSHAAATASRAARLVRPAATASSPARTPPTPEPQLSIGSAATPKAPVPQTPLAPVVADVSQTVDAVAAGATRTVTNVVGTTLPLSQP